MRKAILVLMLLTVPCLGSAEFKDGSTIIMDLKACHNNFSECTGGQQTDYMFSVGYVTGVFDAGCTVNHCPPSNITVNQVIAIFMRWADENPEYWNNSADRLISATFRNVWPCQSDAEILR